MVVLFLLIASPILVIISFMLYWVPKILGYPRAGKILSSIIVILFVSLTFYLAFEDLFFSKKDAEDLLAEQNVKLTDDYELLKNESMSAIGALSFQFELNYHLVN